MPWSAILVVDNSADPPAAPTTTIDNGARYTAKCPSLACGEIFGRSILARIVGRLQEAGARTVSVISGPDSGLQRTRYAKITTANSTDDRWSLAAGAIQRYARQGITTVLVAKIGAYVEADFEAAIRFHESCGQPTTPLYDDHGPLGYWIADAARHASSRSTLFPLNECEMPVVTRPYVEKAYVNHLADAHDLRRLVRDAFLGRCSIAPRGREIKPGVWVENTARWHRTTRLVAPVYVGCNARLKRATIVTRFTNIERHGAVGEGSVVADSSLLPHTTIGKALDVFGAVVNGPEFTDLRRNITLTIDDPCIISGPLTRKHRSPDYCCEHQAQGYEDFQPQLDSSQYLSRAAGRLLEVFRGGL